MTDNETEAQRLDRHIASAEVKAQREEARWANCHATVSVLVEREASLAEELAASLDPNSTGPHRPADGIATDLFLARGAMSVLRTNLEELRLAADGAQGRVRQLKARRAAPPWVTRENNEVDAMDREYEIGVVEKLLPEFLGALELELVLPEPEILQILTEAIRRRQARRRRHA